MKCAWQAYLNLIPVWLRKDVDRLGREKLQELRLRLGRAPELVLDRESVWLERPVTAEDLEFTVNIASRYSPWTASSVRYGFITAAGGHRVGICGDAVISAGGVSTISPVTSVSIRVSRDIPGIGQRAESVGGSVLIIGSPGRGKTTLLRDIIRCWSNADIGAIAVVDERREIFPVSGKEFCYDTGPRTDVLTGCSKVAGIEMLLRTMNPAVVALDEITAASDCEALLHAGWCGVRLLATAHAGSREELLTRPVYKPLIQSGLFQNLIVLQQDKSWTLERMEL